MTTINTSGWTVSITHPDTGRKIIPDVLNVDDAPAFNPGPDRLPRVQIPVRKSDAWLSDAFEQDPELTVWKDGRQLPIEVLRDVEQREGVTILKGIGGVELEQRAKREYNDDRRHVKAADLVTNETSYSADAPEPETSTVDDVLQQEATTASELDSNISSASYKYVTETGTLDRVRPSQAAWTTEGELADRSDTTGDSTSNTGEYSSEDYLNLTDGPNAAGPDFGEWDFTPDHDIPEASVGFQVRDAAPRNDGVPAFKWEIEFPDGSTYLIDEITTVGTDLSETPSWTDIESGAYDKTDGYQGPGLTAGKTYTLRAEVTDSNGNTDTYQYNADVVAPYDRRQESDLSFPDSTLSNGVIAGPGRYAATDIVFANTSSTFSITSGSVDGEFSDITDPQRVQISNDGGSTWVPTDGRETNTEDIDDILFSSESSQIRLRVTIGGYEPDGLFSNAPARNYAAQALYQYQLYANIAQELLLIEETFDQSIAETLSEIAEPAGRTWRFTLDSGTPTVRFVQQGQFVANYTPEFNERTREKIGKTYKKVVVKGSNQPVSNEAYTASTSFTQLARQNILSGSETVYDDTQNYERGADYEINYQPGELKITSSGNMVDGDPYRIDYRYQPRGTFTSPDAPTNADELVETISGVTSTTLADQVAFAIASNVATPRYSVQGVIPDPDPRFDPTKAIPPEEIGLPTDVSPVEVQGDTILTPLGLQINFGTRPAVDVTIDRLTRQVARISERS